MRPHLIPGLDNAAAGQIIDLFQKSAKKLNIRKYKLILFGSRAKGNFREGSDIDLALVGETWQPEDREALLMEYDKLFLPWKLDIVVYKSITEPELKRHIDRVGIELS